MIVKLRRLLILKDKTCCFIIIKIDIRCDSYIFYIRKWRGVKRY